MSGLPTVQSTITGLEGLLNRRPPMPMVPLPTATNLPVLPVPPAPSQPKLPAAGPAPNAPGFLMTPAVRPSAAGNVPSLPAAVASTAPIPADTLEIGGQLFGKPVGFGDVRALADGLKPADAASITAGDGLDKIFFTDEAGKNYVFFAEKGHFEDVRTGYLGRYNGSRIQVVAVADEANTFKEGFEAVWKWMHGTLTQAFGTEASKSISGLVATSIGSFIAAAAIKTTAPAPLALPAAKGFLQGIGTSAANAIIGFVNTMASVVLFAVGALGAISLVSGAVAYFKKGDYRTLNMVTGNY